MTGDFKMARCLWETAVEIREPQPFFPLIICYSRALGVEKVPVFNYLKSALI